MTTPERRLMRWRTTTNVVWSIIGGLVLLGATGYALRSIAGALSPFVVAFLFVFAMQGAVAAFERRGMARGWAVAVCFLIGFLALSIVLVFIAPIVGRQLVEFANSIPGLLAQGEAWVNDMRTQFSDVVVPRWLSQATTAILQSTADVFVTLGRTIAEGILGAGSGIANVVFNLFLGIVIAFWTLKDLPKIRDEVRVLAGGYRDDVDNLLSTIGQMVGGYLKGQTIASLVTGTLAFIGLALIGVPFALVLGILTGIFNYVPYIGPFVAGVIAAVMGLVQGPLVALGAIIVIVVAQNATDTLVTPRVMSEQVDLHPTLVIFSLLVGGALLGFWGMIFAIPVAATVKALFVYYYERKTSRQLATEDGALFRTAQCADEGDQECEPAEESQSDRVP